MKTKINSRIFIFKRWFCYSLLVVLIGIFLLPNTAYYSSISEEKIVELTNQERINKGLNIVTANQLLAKAAYEKGMAILETQNFRHNINGKKFSTWIKNAGYQYSYAGENLAIDFVTSEGVIKAWLDSPTHKKNILNENFSEIGIAVLEGKFQGNNTTLVIQIFGSPLNIITTAKKLNNNLLAFYPNTSSPKTMSAPVNPVKYVSPACAGRLVGGFKPPTATNLLPPISSAALFNGVNYKMGENLLTHSAGYPSNASGYLINTNFIYSPVDNIKYIEYNNLNIRQRANNFFHFLSNSGLIMKKNNFFINNPNKLMIINYLIPFFIVSIIIINIYLYYFKYLSYFKTLLHRKK